MPSEVYSAWYRDSFGDEHTHLHNTDGELSLMVRGVEFVGCALDVLALREQKNPACLSDFLLYGRELCDYTLDFTVPVPILYHDNWLEGRLYVHFALGKPLLQGGIDEGDLQLVLRIANLSFSPKNNSGWFNEALCEIQKQLPNGMQMQQINLGI